MRFSKINFKKGSSQIVETYKKQLPVIFFFLLLTHFFLIIRQLPYVNIIENYYFYVVSIYVVISLFIYRKQLSPRRILIGLLILLLTSVLTTLLGIKVFSEMVGFIIVTILFIIIFVALLRDRKSLRI